MKESRDSRNPANVIAGRNLRYFMESRGITNQQLADSFGIEKESLQKILNGRNAISGPYNYILLNTYSCDLNFIYGGISHSDTLTKEVETQILEENKKKTVDLIARQMKYLSGYLDNINNLDESI